jgi:ribosomal protein S18 acetylase RimI-like enzyme
LFLEDFYVLPEYRKNGFGSQLFDGIVSIAKKRGAKRIDWIVLTWNEPAINFYKKQNAEIHSQWHQCRLMVDEK